MRLLTVLLLGMFTGSANSSVRDQLPRPPLPVDPTPLVELISAHERQLVVQASDPKKRVEVFLDLASAHLDTAHNAIKGGSHRVAERELDIYNKATSEAAKIAFAQEKRKRGLAKKLEQQLYRQLKTLELIERLFPAERLAFAEAAIKQAKQLRVQALNTAFDSGEVLNDPEKGKKEGRVPPAEGGFASSPIPRVAMSFVASPQRPASTIPGDYLNEEEDDHVREAQEADQRIKVFMKIAERRLLAITGPAALPTDKKAQKKAEEKAQAEEREWGALPKAGRAELLKHYSRAIEEAVAKLEDAHERNPKSTAIPKALTLLRDATDRHMQTLRSLEAQVKDDSEREALSTAISQAEWANKGAREGLKAK